MFSSQLNLDFRAIRPVVPCGNYDSSRIATPLRGVYSYLAVFKVSLCFLNAFKKLKANESIRKAMLVYELVKNKTIPLEKFIDVGWYKGAGDLEFEKQALGVTRSPAGWASEYKKFTYKFYELVLSKNALNLVKTRLDSLNLNKYDTITAQLRPHESLRGLDGVVCRVHGGKIVTNAWLKMYELVVFMEPRLDRIAASKSKQFNSIHFAEAPGNFILALEHKLSRKYPGIAWSWHANSYRGVFGQTAYLDDKYGLMRDSPERWFFGCEHNGDISSPANIRSFMVQFGDRGARADLVTSDVKFSPDAMNFAEEENANLVVHLGQMISGLVVLAIGGTMILKCLTLFETGTVNMVGLVTSLFDRTLLVKPETSKPFNSEVYLVCLGFRGIGEEIVERLLSILNFYRAIPIYSRKPAIFLKSAYSLAFLADFIRASYFLCNSQITALEANLTLYQKYKKYTIIAIRTEFAGIRDACANQWIQRYMK
jgi:cap2 methyltransferase